MLELPSGDMAIIPALLLPEGVGEGAVLKVYSSIPLSANTDFSGLTIEVDAGEEGKRRERLIELRKRLKLSREGDIDL